MSKEIKAFDFFGNEIKVGDTAVFWSYGRFVSGFIDRMGINDVYVKIKPDIHPFRLKHKSVIKKP